MSSTNTPVTQADVDEWARDIGAHSNNVSGPVYYNVSKAKWDQVHDMLGRLLAERDELQKQLPEPWGSGDSYSSDKLADRLSQMARSMTYNRSKEEGAAKHYLLEAEGKVRSRLTSSPPQPSMGELKAIEGRAEKAEAELADVCAVLDTAELWGWCRDTATPTTGVTMLLDASLAWQERAEKAEASNGVAMLRRLVDFIGSRDGTESLGWQERLLIQERIDLMIAEAEKPAEPCEKPQQDFAGNVCSWKSSKTARQCVETALELADAPSLDDDQLDAVAALLDGPRPKDREGDDVLRALDHHLRAMSDHTDPDRWRGSVESALRTIRRALGEEVKS